MTERCRCCNGSGVKVTWRWGEESRRKIPRVEFCRSCNGVGKRHVCKLGWCKERV